MNRYVNISYNDNALSVKTFKVMAEKLKKTDLPLRMSLIRMQNLLYALAVTAVFWILSRPTACHPCR